MNLMRRACAISADDGRGGDADAASATGGVRRPRRRAEQNGRGAAGQCVVWCVRVETAHVCPWGALHFVQQKELFFCAVEDCCSSHTRVWTLLNCVCR